MELRYWKCHELFDVLDWSRMRSNHLIKQFNILPHFIQQLIFIGDFSENDLKCILNATFLIFSIQLPLMRRHVTPLEFALLFHHRYLVVKLLSWDTGIISFKSPSTSQSTSTNIPPTLLAMHRGLAYTNNWKEKESKRINKNKTTSRISKLHWKQ